MFKTVLVFISVNLMLPEALKKLGKGLVDKFRPAIEEARKNAVQKMSKELENKFPSSDFLAMNFTFDTERIKKLLNKYIVNSTTETENDIKKEMIEFVYEQKDNFIEPNLITRDSAKEIVEVFLNQFETECLKDEYLQGQLIFSKIREESISTREVVSNEAELTRATISNNQTEGFKRLENKLESFGFNRTIYDEESVIRITTKLEKHYIDKRDEILRKANNWQYEGIVEEVVKLSRDVYEVRDKINSEIQASIFRLCGSFLLRTTENKEHALKWINRAEKIESDNIKTIALKADYLCQIRNWKEAFNLLDTVINETDNTYAKVIYAESKHNLEGPKSAYEYLCELEPKDDNINLNYAISAIENEELDIAYQILNQLIAKDDCGPYPHIYYSRVLIRKATPYDLVSISTYEDHQFLLDKDLILLAIKHLKKGIDLLENTTTRITEISYKVLTLCEIYLRIDDYSSAIRYLSRRRYWKILRINPNSWLIASSLAQLKNDKNKTLSRARKAINISTSENINESLISFALISINLQEWSLCLDTLNKIKIESLNDEQLKANLEMKIICFLKLGDDKNFEDNIKILKNIDIKDDKWVLHKALKIQDTQSIDSAISFLEKEKINYPKSLSINWRLISLYTRKKNYNKALDISKENLNISRTVSATVYTCEFAFLCNKPENVLSIIQESVKNDVNSEILQHMKAIALYMTGEIDRALELFREFDRNSLSSNDYLAYSACLNNMMRQADAIVLLEEAKIKYSNDPRIYSTLQKLYLSIDQKKSFEEAVKWLELNPEDQNAYMAVMLTGYAVGEEEAAHNAMVDCLDRFGDTPVFRRANIEDFKESIELQKEQQDQLWKKYQDGMLPEVILSSKYPAGVGGFRILLLEGDSRVMAFDGMDISQRRELANTIQSENILIDYHALITIHQLDIVDSVLDLFKVIFIPNDVLKLLDFDLNYLSSNYQQTIKEYEEKVFELVSDKFKIIESFPDIEFKDIPESIGDTIFDLKVCDELNCSYVKPIFNDLENTNVDLNNEVISIPVIIEYMKEKGLVSTKKYNEISTIIEKQQIIKTKPINTLPTKIMFDWQSLIILTQCGVLDVLVKMDSELIIGPFSYSVIKNKVQHYRKTNELRDSLTKLKEHINKLRDTERIKIIHTSTIQDEVTEVIEGVSYIKNITQTCIDNSYTLYSDDFAFKKLANSNNIKTTSTRTILDIMLYQNKITADKYIDILILLLKWDTYFCWVSTESIVKCADMYCYNYNDEYKLFINSIIEGIKSVENRIPNDQEDANLSVMVSVILTLWPRSDEARLLGEKTFDIVYELIKTKNKLSNYWIEKCIYQFAYHYNDINILKELLQHVSILLSNSHFVQEDEFKLIIKDLLRQCLTSQQNYFIEYGDSKMVASNVLSAVSIAIPNYFQELKNFAKEIDPLFIIH